jgi:hypothetical protein
VPEWTSIRTLGHRRGSRVSPGRTGRSRSSFPAIRSSGFGGSTGSSSWRRRSPRSAIRPSSPPEGDCHCEAPQLYHGIAGVGLVFPSAVRPLERVSQPSTPPPGVRSTHPPPSFLAAKADPPRDHPRGIKVRPLVGATVTWVRGGGICAG